MITKQDVEKFWEKFWFLVWKDDSFKGWIFSIIFLFIFIKFIFFPGLSFVTGTSLPLAIVESCSMYHQGNMLSNFDNWWENHENKYNEFKIIQEQFNDFKMKKGFNKGDILFIIKAKPEKLKIGDIIIFDGGQKNPIIHRVMKINQNTETGEYTFSTIGDNNNGQLGIEKNIKEDQLIGKAVIKLVPYAGWGKLIFFEAMRSKSDRGFCEEN